MVFPSQFRPRKGSAGDFGSSWGSPGTRWGMAVVSAVLTLSIAVWQTTTWWLGALFGLVLSVGLLTVIRRRQA